MTPHPPNPGLGDTMRWLQAHAHEYAGQWIAVRAGQLVATGASRAEVAAAVEDKATTLITRVPGGMTDERTDATARLANTREARLAQIAARIPQRWNVGKMVSDYDVEYGFKTEDYFVVKQTYPIQPLIIEWLQLAPSDMRWLVAEVQRLDYERNLAQDGAADMALYIERLQAERARVLELLRTGCYARALDVLDGKGE